MLWMYDIRAHHRYGRAKVDEVIPVYPRRFLAFMQVSYSGTHSGNMRRRAVSNRWSIISFAAEEMGCLPSVPPHLVLSCR